MREITLSGWTPYAIAASPAGPVWVTVLEPPGLARLEPAGGGVTRRALPAEPMLVAPWSDHDTNLRPMLSYRWSTLL
jgi:streptogramin lyase